MKVFKTMLLSLVIGIALSGCTSAKNSSLSSSKDGVFVSECGYGYAQKPSSITIACADAGMYINEINFTNWQSDSAKGTGYLYVNNCDPDCASGKMIKTAVTLKLDKPIKDSAGKLIFSNLSISSKVALYNGKKSAQFDIGIQPENIDDTEVTAEPAAKVWSPEEATSDLLNRLNSDGELWQVNELATSQAGQYQHKRLGLYSEPKYVIECNLRMSGTWLFVYTDDKSAYDAFGSNYFFRSSPYSAEITYDPVTNLIIILHTSMGGNKTCLNSAYSQLQPYGTD
jgi:hypothetical protein